MFSLLAMIDDIHVLPVNDLRDHDESRDCWCKPRVEVEESGNALVVHSSADGREIIEQIAEIVPSLHQHLIIVASEYGKTGRAESPPALVAHAFEWLKRRSHFHRDNEMTSAESGRIALAEYAMILTSKLV